MRQNQINNIDILKSKRRMFRSGLTSAEAYLWTKLQNNKLGRKFRRQHSIGKYVVDFYCPSEKLAIELDGIVHFTEDANKYDNERTAYLNSMGIRVLRFENWRVFDQTDEVIIEIVSHFQGITTP